MPPSTIRQNSTSLARGTSPPPRPMFRFQSTLGRLRGIRLDWEHEHEAKEYDLPLVRQRRA
jgi:hypothetical protein